MKGGQKKRGAASIAADGVAELLFFAESRGISPPEIAERFVGVFVALGAVAASLPLKAFLEHAAATLALLEGATPCPKTGAPDFSDQEILDEQWLPAPGFVGLYEVSNLGRVRSLDRIDRRGRMIKGISRATPLGKDGYRNIILSRDGRKFNVKPHRLVLMAFVGPPTAEQETCHRNGRRSDNRLSNLRWGTVAENVVDRTRHALLNRGGMAGRARFSEATARAVIAARDAGYSSRSVADVFDVSRSTVRAIWRGLAWRHLEGRATPNPPGARYGIKIAKSKAELLQLLPLGDTLALPLKGDDR